MVVEGDEIGIRGGYPSGGGHYPGDGGEDKL